MDLANAEYIKQTIVEPHQIEKGKEMQNDLNEFIDKIGYLKVPQDTEDDNIFGASTSVDAV